MKKHHLSIVGILFLGYFITILIGTILLLLPISKNITEKIEWYDAMFAATSATCVTGLIPFPTTNWSKFGQIVLLVLIQIGGLGFMTIISLILMMFKKNIGIYHRTVLMQSAGSYSISGVTTLIKRIILLTLLCEIVGAIILSLRTQLLYGKEAMDKLKKSRVAVFGVGGVGGYVVETLVRSGVKHFTLIDDDKID